MLKKNKYKYLFFDLDGTLLNLDTDTLASRYFSSLTEFLVKNGYDAEKVIAAIKHGTYAMLTNNGSSSNEDALTDAFVKGYGENIDVIKLKTIMNDYYEQDFDKLKDIVTVEPETSELIKKLKADGYKLILATNPLFPKIATHKRTRWAGLSPDDFEIITTYEAEYFTKPNLKYYQSILDRIGVQASDCIMVGNDVDEDMCASELGLDVFLITTNLINRHNKDISNFKQGTLKDFYKFI